MRLAHDPDSVDQLRAPTEAEPWRILLSGCLFGWACGVDGDDYGLPVTVADLRPLRTATFVPFCPEAHAMGVPRPMPDLHGGDGFAVLDGTARVLTPDGTDLTAAMLAGAEEMLRVARAARVELALLTDMSAACGSQVISDGCRFDDPRRYRLGVGVAAALLIRAGIPVVSQRDHHTLGRLRARLDPSYVPDPAALDHYDHPWVVANLR